MGNTTMTKLLFFLSALLLCSGCVALKSDQRVFTDEQEAIQAYSSGHYNIAVKRYEALVEEVPEDANFWFRLANAYARNGEPDKAINAYRKTLQQDSTHEKAWYNMGIIQLQQALKTFIDMQDCIPSNSSVKPLAEEKMNSLFLLLGGKIDDTDSSRDEN